MKFPKFTQTEIEDILTQKDLVLRNLQITLGYHRVAKGLKKMIGEKDVNWFAFGAFASKTAGQGLRHELLPGRLKSAMIRSAGFDNTMVYFNRVSYEPEADHPHNQISESLTQVSTLLSRGNLMIFEEVGVPFARLMYTFDNLWQRDDDKLQRFLDDNLNPQPLEEGGQAYLREACTAFYNARFERDAKKKSELVLLGNLLIGYHEQSRLQPVIEKAISVPFDVFAGAQFPDDIAAQPAGLAQRARMKALGITRRLVLRTITRMMMSYDLPTREIRLGKNVVAPTGLINYPRALLVIEDPRCHEVVRQFEIGKDTLSGSAAENWGSLENRMHFLVDFFRSYQRYKPLYKPPFSERQIQDILAGQVPPGPL